MYPTGCVPPKFYGLPKIQKPDTTLRPIVSSCGSVTYGVAKELAKIFKPLVGKSPHHINSTDDFCETGEADNISIWGVPQLLWCFCSVHISPSRSSLGVIKDLLQKDPSIKDRTVLTVKDIVLLLEFCLKKYILFTPRPVLWTGWGCSYGFPGQPTCS